MFAERRLTYGELDAGANELAKYLCSLGVGRDASVGIFMERSPEMILAVLAILKAGAACLPLNPSYPSGRLLFMLEDSGASAIISQRALVAGLPRTEVPVISVDDDLHACVARSNDAATTVMAPEDPAYVIYTSGSTGEPKG